ncbi:unnamed protein product, partial [Ectocarpus sp. 13 AM-2016]
MTTHLRTCIPAQQWVFTQRDLSSGYPMDGVFTANFFFHYLFLLLELFWDTESGGLLSGGCDIHNCSGGAKPNPTAFPSPQLDPGSRLFSSSGSAVSRPASSCIPSSSLPPCPPRAP